MDGSTELIAFFPAPGSSEYTAPAFWQEQEEKTYTYTRTHGKVTTTITFLGDLTVRIHRSLTGEPPRDLGLLLRSKPEEPAVWNDEDVCSIPICPGKEPDTPVAETLTDGAIAVALDKEGVISCRTQICEVRFQEVPGRNLLELDGQLIHSFLLEDNLLYGFGEKTGPLEKTGQRMRFSGKDACGYDPEHTDPLYKSVPFFLMQNRHGLGCMGVFYHTGADCELDMGREVNGYYPPMGQYITREQAVDVVLMFGREMADVVSAFTSLTGRPEMLPKYALGYLGSSMYYPELPQGCDEEILGFVRRAKERKMPCSNFQLSSGYTTDPSHRRNIFTWNTAKFPDPGSFVRQMEELGAPVTPNVKPAMLTTHPLYNIFAQEGAFIRNRGGSPYVTRFWGGEGSFVDFTNPNARKLWKHFLKQSLLSHGIRSLWNDNNEFDISDGYCYDDGKFTPARKLRAILPRLMVETGREALLEMYPGQRPYQVSRSGCAGINRFAQVWTGDNRTSWESLKWNIATMLCSSLSGMPLTGSDVGGFAGPAPDKELLLRWIACGAVMPRFSIHSANDDNTVTEPWMYKSGVPAVQGFFRLRERLMPYLYSLHYRAHRRGTPIWRPMVWQYPGDARCQKENVDFMLGDALLCAPVVEPGAKTRKVYLPPHETFWDIETGERYTGGREITLEAPLDKLILLQRWNSMYVTREEDGLHLWIAGTYHQEFTYYDDDGMSLEPNELVVYDFTAEGGLDLNLRCQPRAGTETFAVELRCDGKAPAQVMANNVTLKRYLDEEQLKQAETGWYYDAERHLARIQPGSFRLLQARFDAVDLIKINGQED